MSGTKKSADGSATGYYAKLQLRERKANHNDKMKVLGGPSSSSTHVTPIHYHTSQTSIVTSKDDNAKNDSILSSGSDRQVAMQARRAANSMYVVSDSNWAAQTVPDTDSCSTSTSTLPRDFRHQHHAVVEDKILATSSNNSIIDSSDDQYMVMASHQAAHIIERSTATKHRSAPDIIGSSTSNDLFRMLDRVQGSKFISKSQTNGAHDSALSIKKIVNDDPSTTSQELYWSMEGRQEAAKKQNNKGRQQKQNLTIITDIVTPSTHSTSSPSSSSVSSLPPMDNWDTEEDVSSSIPIMEHLNLSTDDPQLFMQARREANVIQTDAFSHIPKVTPSVPQAISTLSKREIISKQPVINSNVENRRNTTTGTGTGTASLHGESASKADVSIPIMEHLNLSTDDPQLFMQARREANVIQTDALSHVPKVTPSVPQAISTLSKREIISKQPVINSNVENRRNTTTASASSTASLHGESESQANRTWIMKSKQEANDIRIASARTIISVTPPPAVNTTGHQEKSKIDPSIIPPPPPPPPSTSAQSSSRDLAVNNMHPKIGDLIDRGSQRKSRRSLLQDTDPNPSVTHVTGQFLAHLIQSSSSVPEEENNNVFESIHWIEDDSIQDSSPHPNRLSVTRQEFHNPTKSPAMTTLTSDQLFLHLDSSPPSSHENSTGVASDRHHVTSNRNTMVPSASRNIRNSYEDKHNHVNQMAMNKSPSGVSIPNQASPHPLSSSLLSQKQFVRNTSSTTLSNSLKSFVAAISCAEVNQEEPTATSRPAQIFVQSTNNPTSALLDMHDSKGDGSQSISHELLTFCDPICNSHEKTINSVHERNVTSHDSSTMSHREQRFIGQRLTNHSDSVDESSVFTFVTKSSDVPSLSKHIPSSEGASHPLTAAMSQKAMEKASLSQPLTQDRYYSNSIASASTSSYKLAKEMNQKNLLDEASVQPQTILNRKAPTSPPSRSILKENPTTIDWELEWIKSQLQLKHMLATTVVDWFKSEADLAALVKQMDGMQNRQLQYEQEIQRLSEGHNQGDTSDVLSGTHSSISDNGRKEELQRDNFKLKATIRKMKADAQKDALKTLKSEADLAALTRQMDGMQKRELQHEQEIQRLLERHNDCNSSDVLSVSHSSISDNGRKEDLQRENFKLKATVRKMKADAQNEALKMKELMIHEDGINAETSSSSSQDHVSEKLTLRAELVELKSQMNDLKLKNMELRADLDKEKLLHEKAERQLDSEIKSAEKTEAMHKEIHSLQFVLKIKTDSIFNCKAQIACLEKEISDLRQKYNTEVDAYERQILDLKDLIDQDVKDSVTSTKSYEDENLRGKIIVLEQQLAISEREKSEIPKIGGRVEARVLAYKRKYEQLHVKYEQSLANEKDLKEKIIILENELDKKTIIVQGGTDDPTGMTIQNTPSDLVTEKASNVNSKSSFSDDECIGQNAKIQDLELEIELIQAQLSATTSECDSLLKLVEQYQGTEQELTHDKQVVDSLRIQLDEALGKIEFFVSQESSQRSLITSLEKQLEEHCKVVEDSILRSDKLTNALNEKDVLLNEVSLASKEKQRLENEILKLSSELINTRAQDKRLSIKAEVDLAKLKEVETQLRKEIDALREQVAQVRFEKDEQERLALDDNGIAEQLRKRDEKLGQYEHSIQTLIEEMHALTSKHQDDMKNINSAQQLELEDLRQSKSQLLQILTASQSYAEGLKKDYDILLQQYETELDYFKDTQESLRLQLLRYRRRPSSMDKERALESRTRAWDTGDEVEIEMLDIVNDDNDDAENEDDESETTPQDITRRNLQSESMLISQIESLRSSLLEAQKQSEKWKQLYDQHIQDSILSVLSTSTSSTHVTTSKHDTLYNHANKSYDEASSKKMEVRGSRPYKPSTPIVHIGKYDDSPTVIEKYHYNPLSSMNDQIKNELSISALD